MTAGRGRVRGNYGISGNLLKATWKTNGIFTLSSTFTNYCKLNGIFP